MLFTLQWDTRDARKLENYRIIELSNYALVFQERRFETLIRQRCGKVQLSESSTR